MSGTATPKPAATGESGRLLRSLAAGAALLFAGLSSRAAADPPATFREYDVKAVFLYHFAQFVDWPPQALADTNASLIIGVLGADPFGGVLERTVRNETVRDRPLVVRRFRRLEDVTSCHLLFVSSSEKPRFQDILRALSGRGILTVGDADPFTRLGGIVNFRTERNHVQLEINLAAAEREGFKISAKLLGVARVVDGGPPKEGR
jgi:hypothetical protein